MIQRFEVFLFCVLIIIFALCVTVDEAGVVLKNFKSRRMIMEELEKEELKAQLNLKLTNSTAISNEKDTSLTDNRNLNNGSNKIINIGLKADSQTKNLKTSPKKSMVFPPTTPHSKSVGESLENRGNSIEDKNKSRKSNILTNSFVEYLENRGKRTVETISRSTNEISLQKPNILTHSFVEYSENRGKRMVEAIPASGNSTTPISIFESQMNESSPFRLNEISENSSLAESVDLDRSQVEQEDIFTALSELSNHTSKNSDEKPNADNGQQLKMNITDIVKEIFDPNINDLSKNSFTEVSPKPQEKENNDKIAEESTDLEHLASRNPMKDSSSLKILPNDLISSVHTEEQSKNFNVNTTTEDNKKFLNDGAAENEVINKEIKDNKSLIEETVREIEDDRLVKPFELKESSVIIEETAKEIPPESNEAVANIEEVNLTGTIETLSDESLKDDQKEDPFNESELSLESVVSSGLDFLVNSEVAKNAAMAIEVFNLSDSSLTDHVIEDSDMHSFIDIVMPPASLSEMRPNESSNSSLKVVPQNTSHTNSILNLSLAEELESASDLKPNATSERRCPTPGICIFWFMARDTCSDHSQCLDGKICCRVRCSKSCIHI